MYVCAGGDGRNVALDEAATDEVYGVSHHRVGSAVQGADLAGGHPPAVDPDPNRKVARLLDDVAQGEKHSLFVIADGTWSSCRQD